MTTALLKSEYLRSFLLAGRARFSLLNTRTGGRRTYRLRVSDDGRVIFVSVQTGPNNETDFQYIGTVVGDRFRYGEKSKIAKTAPSVEGFAKFWAMIDVLPSWLEVYHEGMCGRCGRALTVPSSIETGLGPECLKKSAA